MPIVTASIPRAMALVEGRILADGPREEIFAQLELLAEAGVEPSEIIQIAMGEKINEPVMNVQ